MLFTSLAYAVFLPLVFVIYWLMPHKARWVLLLVASYYFYMSWNVKYSFLIIFTTLISYIAAILMEKSNNQTYKKWILTGTSIACLGVLFLFKYFNFISKSVASFMKLFTIQMDPFLVNLLLPIGISFYTFQTLSYVIDVYRGEAKAEHHLGYYATFVSFFPQLVAGPIERTKDLLPQIKAEHTFDYDKTTYGLKLMAWGYFKKLIIADTLAYFVQQVYDAPQAYTGFSLVLATMFFAVEIYCDFSGYSDIAIGTAKLLGIDLTSNFRSPYFSQSIKEFWSRWHISLSTWFRDYVYIPLGGNRVGKIRHSINLLITFVVSGLWHGANGTFLIWGGIHGIGQVIENALVPANKLKSRSKGAVGLLRIIVVLAFTTFAWTFFVSNSLTDAVYVIRHFFDGITSPLMYLENGVNAIEIELRDKLIIVASLVILVAYDYASFKVDVIKKISSLKAVWRWMIYVILVLWIIITLPGFGQSEFIYFQF